jgi:hypothetical protein
MIYRYTAKVRGDGMALLEGEKEDVRQEAIDVAGEEWLYSQNIRFGGRTPMDVIRDDQEEWVRDVLRSIKYVGFS